MGDSRTIMIKIDADGRAAVVETQKSSKEITQSLDGIGPSAVKIKDKFGDMVVPAASIISVYALGAAVKTVTSESLRYLGQLETSGLGIATSFMTGGKYIDQTSGKVLQGAEALKVSQVDSARTMEQLQIANMQTIATLDQLVRAYQEALPVAMAKGFNRNQVLEFTTSMVQAAGAIGLRMDQLGEEIRSILTGAIDPRTSRIATVLGLRNEDIKEHSKNAQQLFDFLMQKLDAYKVAGLESQKTWDGLWSNTKDIALQAGGQTFQPLFDQIKYELIQITSHMVTVDNVTKKINWNPDFVDGVQSLRSGVNSIVAEVYRLGMLIDKAGGSMTAFGSRTLKVAELVTRFMTIGQFGDGLKNGSEQMAKWNKMFESRYNSKDKAVLAMAYREAGLDENGNPLTKPSAADYQQNDPTKDKKAEDKARKAAESAARNSRDISMILEQARERDLLIGKSKDEKELLQLGLKHSQEMKRMIDHHASQSKIADLTAIQTKEKADLIAQQKEQREYQSMQSSAKIAEAEFQAKAQWLDKLEAYQVKTGQLSDGTALDNKFQRERDLLALKQKSVAVDLLHEKDQTKQNELAAEYWRIEQQILKSKQEQVWATEILTQASIQAAHNHEAVMYSIAANATVQRLQLLGEEQAAQAQLYQNRRDALEEQFQWEMEHLQLSTEQRIQKEREYAEAKAQLNGDQQTAQMQYNIDNNALIGENYELALDAIHEEHQTKVASLDNQVLLVDDYNAKKAGLEANLANEINALEKKKFKTQRDLTQSGFASMASIADAFYQLSGKRSKEALIAFRVMKSGETIISTASSAMKAYDAMASIPYVGPALGAAAAAAAVMAGAAQLSAIWSVGDDGSGGTISAGGGSAVTAPTSVSAPTTSGSSTTTESTALEPIVNVHIYGNVVDHDQFAREMTSALKKAWKDAA